jgi:hypothetical protein
MSELQESHRNLLKHIHGGGLVAVAIYGKTTQTREVLSRPTYREAGLKGIDHLRELGLVRYGDPSPYKSGMSLPVVLTDAGKNVVSA